MLLERLFRSTKPRPISAPRPRPGARLSIESLDDRVVPATLSVGDATVVEAYGGTYAEIAVTLSDPSNKTVQVNYKPANGTALAWGDYLPTSGTLTFAPGEISKTILVKVNGDGVAEADETFLVNLSHAKGAKIADGQGVVTIVDDGVDNGYVDSDYLPDYGYFGNGGPYEY
jgi:endoglucanase